MNIIILSFLGIATGLLVSKSQRYNKKWDILIGALGAFTFETLINNVTISFSALSWLLIMFGSAVVIYVGRFLRVFPQD
ncbi:MAG: hypothetical protein P4L74_06625 [Candidatus Doudnabacteria bacterium]|nr:hypothetical protein [Candidatus Doudnabacteria bacterium]